MSFEDKLTQSAINVNIHPEKMFEIFLKKYEEKYSFISIINEEVSHEEDPNNRYIVKCEPTILRKKFLGILLEEKKIIYHIIISKISYVKGLSNSDKLHLFVYGQSYYENLKKIIANFVSNNPDIVVNITLESVNEDYYVYDEIISKDNIWKKFLRLFYKETEYGNSNN